MDPFEIEALAGLRPLFDPVFRHLIERAVTGHVDVYFAAVPRALIRPFDSDYNPARHPVGRAAISEVHAKWRSGDFTAIWVYPRDNEFIMSDDYIVWEAVKEGKPDFVPCWILGKPDLLRVKDLQGPLDESGVTQALGFAAKYATSTSRSADSRHRGAPAQDFAALREQWEGGSVSINIDRGFARQFFTDLTLSEIETRIGERPVRAWLLVFGAFLLAPTALLVTCVFAVIVLGWFSTVAIPVAVAIYITFQSSSISALSRLGIISWMLAISILAFVLFAEPSNRLGQAMISVFLLSLWALRFMYVSAPHFLRGLILRNVRAYDLVRDQIRVASK
jgi:hypothetical protein